MMILLRIIGLGIGSLIIPIILLSILADVSYYLYQSSAPEGIVSVLRINYSGIPYWWYMLYSIILILVYFGMKRKIFLICIVSWITILLMPIIFFNKPIQGLITIPDSYFTLSGADIDNLPKVSEELCSKRKQLLHSLSGSLGLTALWNEGKKVEAIENGYTQYLPLTQYINVTYSGESMKNYHGYELLVGLGTLGDTSEIMSGKIMMEDVVELLPEETKIKYKEDVIQGDVLRGQYYVKWKQFLAQYGSYNFISLFYSPEELNLIYQLIDIVDTMNNNGFGYCITSGASLAEELNPPMGDDFRIIKILGRYSSILAGMGKYDDSYKILSSLGIYIKNFEKSVVSSLGVMMNIAMKGSYYENLTVIQKFDFPPELYEHILYQLQGFDNISLLINGLRGDYYGIVHLYHSKQINITNIHVPIVFDGIETDMILRNAMVAYMNDIPTSNIEGIGKYINKENRLKEFQSDFGSNEWNIHNFFGKKWLREVIMPRDSNFSRNVFDSYIRRVLYNQIERNTLLKK